MNLKKLFAAALAALMLVVPVAAAEPSAWALGELTDSEALGMLTQADMEVLQSTVTHEKLQVICNALDSRLAAAGLEKRADYTLAPVAAELTRGAVMNALADIVCSYAMPDGVLPEAADAAQLLQALGVVRGYSDGSVQADRLCTLEEAFVMGSRCVTALVDLLDDGSNGFLWKAEKDGTTVYLLGTIHIDRGSIYPFGSQLRGVMADADRVVFEVDFGNEEGLAAYAAMQVYSDGTSLSDHIDADLYQQVVELLAPYGYDESIVSTLKPWVVANLVTSLQASDVQDADVSAPMVIDMYVYSRSLVDGKDIAEIEGYAYQAELFDSLSAEYQNEYLRQAVELFLAGSETESAAESVNSVYDEWIGMWIDRDIDGFTAAYPKDEAAMTEDELNSKLFGERDDNMSAYVKNLLDAQDGTTSLVVVGAGHMIGETGIVQQLLDAGYTVAPVPVE